MQHAVKMHLSHLLATYRVYGLCLLPLSPFLSAHEADKLCALTLLYMKGLRISSSASLRFVFVTFR